MCAVAADAKEPDPVASAVEAFDRLDTYTVTLRAGDVSSGNSAEVIRYFYRKPGFVRMEFVTPRRGAVLVYDPVARSVTVRPFGFLKRFVLTMSPKNRLIRSSRGHTVDKSDIGALLENVTSLKEGGTVELKGVEDVSGRQALRIRVTGAPGAEAAGTHAYDLWMDAETGLPIRVNAYDIHGDLTEDVLMDDLAVDPELPEGFFSIRHGGN